MVCTILFVGHYYSNQYHLSGVTKDTVCTILCIGHLLFQPVPHIWCSKILVCTIPSVGIYYSNQYHISLLTKIMVCTILSVGHILFQPVPYVWCNKNHDVYYPVRRPFIIRDNAAYLM